MNARAHRFAFAIAFVLSAGVSGCVGIPNPLAPGLRGSIGAPSRGVLTEGEKIPQQGPGFALLRPQGARYGTHALVAAIEDAAALADNGPGSPPLVVGDLSQKGGGRIPGHASHRVGRDADLLYFYTTPTGEPVRAPGFVRVGTDGLAPIINAKGDVESYVRLDIPREWRLVRALVTSAQADVLWLFCSEPVEALLIEYARARGEPADVVWRAESVLQQPTDSLPHDDHLHLRVACSADDAVTGCLSGAPAWPWLRPPPKLVVASDEAWPLLLAD